MLFANARIEYARDINLIFKCGVQCQRRQQLLHWMTCDYIVHFIISDFLPRIKLMLYLYGLPLLHRVWTKFHGMYATRRVNGFLNARLLHTVYMITRYFHFITIYYARHNISSFRSFPPVWLSVCIHVCCHRRCSRNIKAFLIFVQTVLQSSFALNSTVFQCAFSTALGFVLLFSCPHRCA